MSFLELRFLEKMALWEGALSPSQKTLSKSNGLFSDSEDKCQKNDTQTPELAKSLKEMGNICDRLWHFFETWK